MNTEDHGIPQHRPRLYICGIRRDTLIEDFHWPSPIEEQCLEPFLDPRGESLALSGLPPESANNARAAVLNFIQQAEESGIDHTIAPLVVGCDTSVSWPKKPMYDRSPALHLVAAEGVGLLIAGEE